MRHFWRQWALWLSVLVGSGALHYVFSHVIGMPAASLLTAALVATWLIPQPWRVLLPLSIIGEMVAITPPLTLAGALWAPVVIFWLRGRIQADVSFSYAILVAVSAALALGIAVGGAVYPQWQAVPWSQVLVCWIAITASAFSVSLLLLSAQSRFLHGRYF